jgi:alpha-tubulin suppressor-like RCC1 family protein
MGSNEFGQLGLNSKVKNRNLPTLVNGKDMVDFNNRQDNQFVAYHIAAGAYHSLAIFNSKKINSI